MTTDTGGERGSVRHNGGRADSGAGGLEARAVTTADRSTVGPSAAGLTRVEPARRRQQPPGTAVDGRVDIRRPDIISPEVSGPDVRHPGIRRAIGHRVLRHLGILAAYLAVSVA